MLKIKVLGSGCPNCQKVEDEHTRRRSPCSGPQGDTRSEHVKDPLGISEYVLKTPGLVINEKVVSEGRIPDSSEIMTWLADALTSGITRRPAEFDSQSPAPSRVPFGQSLFVFLNVVRHTGNGTSSLICSTQAGPACWITWRRTCCCAWSRRSSSPGTSAA